MPTAKQMGLALVQVPRTGNHRMLDQITVSPTSKFRVFLMKVVTPCGSFGVLTNFVAAKLSQPYLSVLAQ